MLLKTSVNRVDETSFSIDNRKLWSQAEEIFSITTGIVSAKLIETVMCWNVALVGTDQPTIGTKVR